MGVFAIDWFTGRSRASNGAVGARGSMYSQAATSLQWCFKMVVLCGTSRTAVIIPTEKGGVGSSWVWGMEGARAWAWAQCELREMEREWASAFSLFLQFSAAVEMGRPAFHWCTLWSELGVCSFPCARCPGHCPRTGTVLAAVATRVGGCCAAVSADVLSHARGPSPRT